MSAKNCRRDAMILLFMLAITLAFAKCQCELERLGNGVSKTHGNLAGLSSSDQGVSFSQWTHNLK